MPYFQRMTTLKQVELDEPAAAVWELLIDWAGISKYWGHVPVETMSAVLIGDRDRVPRTRRISADGATIDEILLHQDDVARRLYYSVQDDGVPGVRNYIATVFVDEIVADRCRVSIAGTYDVVDDADGPASKAFIELVYEAGIIGGISQYLKQRIPVVI